MTKTMKRMPGDMYWFLPFTKKLDRAQTLQIMWNHLEPILPKDIYKACLCLFHKFHLNKEIYWPLCRMIRVHQTGVRYWMRIRTRHSFILLVPLTSLGLNLVMTKVSHSLPWDIMFWIHTAYFVIMGVVKNKPDHCLPS